METPLRHLAAAAFAAACGTAAAQPMECTQTPEGLVCRVTQRIVAGELVPVEDQRQLGLVTVGGCSGTLLNRYWVLTARHCVTTNALITGPLRVPADVTVTATWRPGRVGVASRIHELAPNRPTPRRDIVLVYLGAADLGESPPQRLYAVARPRGNGSVLSGRLVPQDTVVQFGRGYSTYASGTWGGMPPPTPAQGLGTYRRATLRPSSIDATHYVLAMNASSQVGAGGDSGGPTWVANGGRFSGIAGVQSTCAGIYLPGAPRQWVWATRITSCTYVSTEPVLGEILQTIKEQPACAAAPAFCALPAVLEAALRE